MTTMTTSGMGHSIGSSASSVPSLTSGWSGRSRERALLSALLQPRRSGSHVVVWGPRAQGKTSIVLDVLASNQCHVAFADAARSDRYMLKRLAQHVQEPRLARDLMRGLAARGAEADEEEPHAHSGETRGRKRKSVGGGGGAGVGVGVGVGVVGASSLDGGEIPLHPSAMVEDLLGRTGSEKSSRLVTTAAGDAADSSTSATASAAAAAGLISFQSSTRSQLSELVRTIAALRHAAFLAGHIQDRPADTLFIVIDNAHRLADGPALLAALCALPSQTQYPVVLVLIAPSLPTPDPTCGMFGLPHHLAAQFLPVRFHPYTPRQSAGILSQKLWETNRYIEAAFRPAAAAASEPTRALTHSEASVALGAFRDFLERVCEVLADPLANAMHELETQVRRLLPRYLQLVRAQVAAGAVKIDQTQFDASTLSAKILQQMDHELKERCASVWSLEPTARDRSQEEADADDADDDANAKSTRKKAATNAAVAASCSSLAASPVASPSRTPSLARGSLVPAASSRRRVADLAYLGRTSKYLLLASFLASYNPASSDTSLFTTTRAARWNRRGKSAALDRKRRAFDAESSSAQSQLTQIALGPNAAPLERVLAIYQVVCDDERLGLAACYAQLKALIAAHYLEQICVGGGGGGGRRGDLLAGVKVRCLVSQEEMERVCESIEPRSASAANATVAQDGSVAAAAQAIKMGERITLSTYLYDGAKRK